LSNIVKGKDFFSNDVKLPSPQPPKQQVGNCEAPRPMMAPHAVQPPTPSPLIFPGKTKQTGGSTASPSLPRDAPPPSGERRERICRRGTSSPLFPSLPQSASIPPSLTPDLSPLFLSLR
jgi:hypothetical protein